MTPPESWSNFLQHQFQVLCLLFLNFNLDFIGNRIQKKGSICKFPAPLIYHLKSPDDYISGWQTKITRIKFYMNWILIFIIKFWKWRKPFLRIRIRFIIILQIMVKQHLHRIGTLIFMNMLPKILNFFMLKKKWYSWFQLNTKKNEQKFLISDIWAVQRTIKW